jgi:hypothetical protein
LHGLVAGFGRREAGRIENTVALQRTAVIGAKEAMHSADSSHCKQQWNRDQQQITAVMIAR